MRRQPWTPLAVTAVRCPLARNLFESADARFE